MKQLGGSGGGPLIPLSARLLFEQRLLAFSPEPLALLACLRCFPLRPARVHGASHSSVGYSAPRVLPWEHDLRRAAEVLNAGKKVAMLVGAGVLNAADEVMQVAEVLGAGVAKALLGKAVPPDDRPT